MMMKVAFVLALIFGSIGLGAVMYALGGVIVWGATGVEVFKSATHVAALIGTGVLLIALSGLAIVFLDELQ